MSYHQGGYVTGPSDDSVPIPLHRGCVLMSYASYQAVGGEEGAKKLWPDSDIEIVFTAEEVREHGEAMLEKLRRQLNAD